MSLYNALFGVNPIAEVLLASLGLTKNDVPRFRDCFLQDGQIVIHTRTGGGNREEYESENDDLHGVPGFLRDADDDFDSTYANFYYAMPEGLDTLLAENEKVENVPPGERWGQLLNDLRNNPDSPEAQKARAVGKQIFAKIKEGQTLIEV